jgi:leucyl aminopeptidase (aminopeptidase T)
VLPRATFIDFNTTTKEDVIAAFDRMQPRDLVVLVQTTDFRLNEFRIRIHLFKNKLKVIDHQHLYRTEEDAWETYVRSLAYDTAWYHGTGHRLKSALVEGSTLKIQSPHTELVVTGGVDEPKLNIGDYTDMENIGGSFPIGEVFTEAKDLTQVNGSLLIDAFAGKDFMVRFFEPFRIDIKNGLIVDYAHNAPQEFIEILEEVKAHERPLIREIGFGLNRAITREHYVKDITAFERILGMHVSLGEKHTVYKKQGITPDKTRFHVDLFPVVDKAFIDDKPLIVEGQYVI